MASSAQLRSWWSAYRCVTSKYERVAIPGVGRTWDLWVAAPSAPLFRAFADVMTQHNYLFRESAGGTYNCRFIGGTSTWSLHAYAIAIDLNPSKNRFGQSGTDMPVAFRNDIKAIKVDGVQAFTWGGDWTPTSSKDPMHWQINLSPGAAAKYQYAGPSGGFDMLAASKLGDKGPHVSALQVMLHASGFNPGTVDGSYGPNTSTALLALRKSVGSSATTGDVFDHWAYEQVHQVHSKKFGGGGTPTPGPKGDKGDKGDPGEDGKDGKDGQPATLTIKGDQVIG